ncbi:hypothetical protein GFS31_01510 [Leptolyngbya sp. BL0902]|nr:hypothetical protein GFS31_01510 [Leptolyngbya sp. BL0902]
MSLGLSAYLRLKRLISCLFGAVHRFLVGSLVFSVSLDWELGDI